MACSSLTSRPLADLGGPSPPERAEEDTHTFFESFLWLRCFTLKPSRSLDFFGLVGGSRRFRRWHPWSGQPGGSGEGFRTSSRETPFRASEERGAEQGRGLGRLLRLALGGALSRDQCPGQCHKDPGPMRGSFGRGDTAHCWWSCVFCCPRSPRPLRLERTVALPP